MPGEIAVGSGMHVEHGEIRAHQARRDGVEGEGEQFHGSDDEQGRPMGRHGKEPAIFGSLRGVGYQNGLKTGLHVTA